MKRDFVPPIAVNKSNGVIAFPFGLIAQPDQKEPKTGVNAMIDLTA
jgi:hypothetical protein